MVRCADCDALVSRSAVTCPACGNRWLQGSLADHLVFFVAVVLLLIGIFDIIIFGSAFGYVMTGAVVLIIALRVVLWRIRT